MQYGTVISFFPDKGFGFIRADCGKDVFFHISALGACESTPTIEPGQPVKFERAPRKSTDSRQAAGPRAELVELISRQPGFVVDPPNQWANRHPRARGKKPTWRH